MQQTSSWVEQQMYQQYVKADKTMLQLLAAQWLIASSLSAMSYHTYIFGFISGGIIFLIPLLLFKKHKGTRFYRNIIALCMMSFSTIYIQQHLGRIEMHFHVFVMMAFLSYYNDYTAIVTATVHTLVYHILFTYLQIHSVTIGDMPLVVYNYGCGWDITFLHAFFAVSEGIVVGLMTVQQFKNRYNLLKSKHEIEMLNKNLQKQIIDKERLYHETTQLHQALEQNSIISRANPKGKIVYANKKFCDISGFTQEELIGKPHNIIRHPETPKALFKKLWKTIQNKEVFHTTLKNLTKDGEEYFVDLTIIPLLNEDGEIYEYLSVRDDITELVQTQNRLAKELSKDRFLANMSHELRTPLNAIIGFIKLASKEDINEKTKSYLDISLQNSQQLLFLLNDILDIAKMKSGKFSLDYAPFDLKNSLKTLTLTFANQAKLNHLSLKDNFDDVADVTLNGDWHRISQILTNLISNAMKFTPASGTITLNAHYEGNVLTCKVSDTGIGLTKEAQQRVFKEFEQADTSTTREYGGTGLGLSISSELANMMKGSLKVQSQEGQGSTFTLTLPLQSVTYASEKSDAKTELLDADTFKGHALIVEDNKTNQMLIEILLDEYGLSSEVANDGLEALKIYKKDHFQIIFMDENMPNLGGIQTMYKLRKQYDKLPPIVALTANTMKGDKERFLEAGMDDFIAKPIDNEDLLAVLKKYLPRKA